MKYALFLGCTIPARLNNYDASARKVAEVLGIELVDMKGAGCCGPVFVRSLDYETHVAMAAVNLAIAEDMKLDIVTLCNGCFGALQEANFLLKKDEELRRKTNEILKGIDLEFKGNVNVKHFVDVLYGDYGISKVKQRVEKPFKGLRVAVHYGCHVLKPSEVCQFDSPESPHILDELVEITGAKSVDWPLKMLCCGAPVLATSEEVALKLAREKLSDAKKAGAECMVTICPFCEVMFDTQQLKIEAETGEKFDLPALFYPQLLGLTLGLKPDELGFYLNRVPADKIVESHSK